MLDRFPGRKRAIGPKSRSDSKLMEKEDLEPVFEAVASPNTAFTKLAKMNVVKTLRECLNVICNATKTPRVHAQIMETSLGAILNIS